MFKQRAITAVIIGIIFLVGVIKLDGPLVAVFLGAIWLLGIWEWTKLASITDLTKRIAITAVIGLIYLAVYSSVSVSNGLSKSVVEIIAAIGTAFWVIAVLWVQSYPSSVVFFRTPVVRMLLGLLVTIPAWVGMMYLDAVGNYASGILTVLFIVAANDIGAYLSGRTFGKRKLAPKVSPGKTWEGLWGGVIAAQFVAFGCSFYWASFASFNIWEWQLIALGTTIAAVYGDLFESMMKRFSGIKDSGRILPGHGGVLDRLDSLSAAYPVFTLLYLHQLG